MIHESVMPALARSVAQVRYLHDRGESLTERELADALHSLHAELSRAAEATRAALGLTCAEAEAMIEAELNELRRGPE